MNYKPAYNVYWPAERGQGGVKSTVFWVFEDLKSKVSECYDQNWWFPASAQLAVSAKLRQLTGQSQKNTNLGPNIMKF